MSTPCGIPQCAELILPGEPYITFQALKFSDLGDRYFILARAKLPYATCYGIIQRNELTRPVGPPQPFILNAPANHPSCIYTVLEM